MLRTPALLVGFVLGAVAGCRGCVEERVPPSVEAPRQPQSRRADLLARISARKLDPGKKYPLAADGSVQCASDLDCFVAQAERCARATVDTTLTTAGFGVEQRVQAVYRITGTESGVCKLERDVLAVDSAFDDKVIGALRKRNKTDEEIEGLRTQALDDLLDRYPARITCAFEPDAALSVALDLAERKYRPQPWRDSCTELAGPKAKVGIAPQAKPAASP